jgi:CDP-glycerol glycerophosphotransferase (TagB/SpsB family)
VLAKIQSERKSALKRDLLGIDIGNNKILLYPESIRQRENMRFHTFQTCDEFVASVVDLINAINEINGFHLVIRLHPGSGREINPTSLKFLLPKTEKLTVISADRPFSEILTIADLLINYSSTVIEEALLNYIPVLLFDRANRYQHFEAQVLKYGSPDKLAAIYYLNDSKYLKDGLNWIYDNHLSKNVPRSIFDKYLFKEDYSDNLFEFVSSTVK